MTSWSSAKTEKKVVKTLLLYFILTLGSLMMFLPLIYALVSSLKPNAEIFIIPIKWIPSKIEWSNYTEPFRNYPFPRYFFNSFFVATVVTAINLFLCSLAGYGLAKFSFPGRNLIFIIILGTLMLPLQTTFLPLYLIVKYFNWLNSYKVLIIPSVVDAFSVFLFRQYIQTIPDAFIDAARIDGCGEFGIFWRIILPMSTPAIAVVGILTFLLNWQSYLWPLITISKEELRTLPLGLVSFQQNYYAQYGQLFAISLLSILPILIVFILFQRKFIAGVVLSGIKG